MKVLAIEKDVPGVAPESFKAHSKAEARRVWELYQGGVLRECYFRQDKTNAVLVLECRDADHARDILGSLPLVANGLIAFDIIPLAPYPGFARLFAEPS